MAYLVLPSFARLLSLKNCNALPANQRPWILGSNFGAHPVRSHSNRSLFISLLTAVSEPLPHPHPLPLTVAVSITPSPYPVLDHKNGGRVLWQQRRGWCGSRQRITFVVNESTTWSSGRPSADRNGGGRRIYLPPPFFSYPACLLGFLFLVFFYLVLSLIGIFQLPSTAPPLKTGESWDFLPRTYLVFFFYLVLLFHRQTSKLLQSYSKIFQNENSNFISGFPSCNTHTHFVVEFQCWSNVFFSQLVVFFSNLKMKPGLFFLVPLSDWGVPSFTEFWKRSRNLSGWPSVLAIDIGSRRGPHLEKC